MKITSSKDIIDFWFSERVSKLHFAKNTDFDKEVYDLFFATYEKALNGGLVDWQETPEGSLALIILLDQFSRNMFRNTPKSFESDKQARDIARLAIKNQFDHKLSKEQRVFLYMPFMHSENLKDQEVSIDLYKKLGIEENLKFAVAHYDIIKRFGRFPHRNSTLGRKSTNEEVEFLKNPNSGF